MNKEKEKLLIHVVPSDRKGSSRVGIDLGHRPTTAAKGVVNTIARVCLAGVSIFQTSRPCGTSFVRWLIRIGMGVIQRPQY